MDSYIVRIYRRDRESPERITGTVELAASQKVFSFQSSEELVEILTALDGADGDQQPEGPGKR